MTEEEKAAFGARALTIRMTTRLADMLMNEVQDGDDAAGMVESIVHLIETGDLAEASAELVEALLPEHVAGTLDFGTTARAVLRAAVETVDLVDIAQTLRPVLDAAAGVVA